jgi:hypothetical protein
MKIARIMFLILLTMCSILSANEDINIEINNYYKYGNFKEYIKNAKRLKIPDIYGKIGKSYFFLNNYPNALKYLSMGYNETKELDLLNFYSKCMEKVKDSATIFALGRKYLADSDYNSLAIGMYLNSTNDTLLNCYVDSIISKYRGSELSFVAQERLFYRELDKNWYNDSLKISFLTDYITKYNDTYWHNEAAIYLAFSLAEFGYKKRLNELLADSLLYIEAKAHIIDKLIDLGYYRKSIYNLLKDMIEQPLDKPMFVSEEKWELDKKRTFKVLRQNLARYYLKYKKIRFAEKIIDEAIDSMPYDNNDYISNAELYYYLAKIQIKGGKYYEGKKSIIDGLIEGYYEDSLNALYNRNYPGKPLSFAKKTYEYCGPVFNNATIKRGLNNIKATRVAVGDVDNDGYPDILIDGKLFHNKRGKKFIDVSERAGFDLDGITGGFFADFNNDGDVDVFLISRSKGIFIYGNMGNGIFNRVFEDTTLLYCEAALPVDFNHDGFPDIYIARKYNPQYDLGDEPAYLGDMFFKNRGNFIFENFSKQIGIESDKNRSSSGITAFDYNKDGNMEIYISNDRFMDNRFFKFKNRKFTDISRTYKIAGINNDGWWGHSIGSTAGDIDGDGDFDLIVCNLASPRFIRFSDNTNIYINNGDSFTDIFNESGIKCEETNTNPILADFDHDGDLDLYITSKHKGKKSYLYLNDGKGCFRDVTYLSGTRCYNTMGSAVLDFDRDGDMDIIVCSLEGINLFENIRDNENSYLELKLTGNRSGSDAFGSRVVLAFADKKIVKYVHSTDGIGCQNDRIIHFGFILDYGPIDHIEIYFPSGKISYLYNVKRGGVLEIIE